jgi:hypothetical protein
VKVALDPLGYERKTSQTNGDIQMKTKYMSMLIISVIMFGTSGAFAQRKQIEASKLAKLENPQKTDEYQLGIQLTIPKIPGTALVTNAILVIDRKREANTNNAKPSDLPRGLVNKSLRRLSVAMYASEVNQQLNDLIWVNLSSMQWKRVSVTTLPDPGIVQEERQAGKWDNRATEFDITSLVRERIKHGRSDLMVTIASAEQARSGLKKDDVEADLSQLSASLIVLYVLEPQTPPWMIKK